MILCAFPPLYSSPGPNGEACKPPRLETDEQVAASQLQITWIANTISQSTADWLIVAGHYPVWYGGRMLMWLVLDTRSRTLLFIIIFFFKKRP